MSKQAIIVFIKNPEKGKVKTRLAVSIGDEAALEVYKKLIRHTFSVLESSEKSVFLYFSNHIPEDSFFQGQHEKRVQLGETLGERMKNAFSEVFELGYEQVCIIGSDCPELQKEHLEDAFKLLEVTDVCIGPANDGGYYVLGMKTLYPSLFENKIWSSDSVFQDTLTDIRELNLDYSQIPQLSDLDTIDDYQNFPDFQV